MKTTILQKPKRMPVGLLDAKRYLKVTHDQEDGVIERLIETATEMVEAYTRRKLVSQVLNSFIPFEPNHKRQKGLQRVWVCADRYVFFLPYGPVSEVMSLERIEEEGTLSPLGRYDFHVNTNTDPAMVVIEKRWGFGVRAVYKVGYDGAIPAPLIQAILTIVGRLYGDRILDQGDVLKHVSTLLAPYVVGRGKL